MKRAGVLSEADLKIHSVRTPERRHLPKPGRFDPRPPVPRQLVDRQVTVAARLARTPQDTLRRHVLLHLVGAAGDLRWGAPRN